MPSPMPAALIYKWLTLLGHDKPDLKPLSVLLALWRLHQGRDDWASPRRYGLIAGCLEALGLHWELLEVGTAVSDVAGERPPILHGRTEGLEQSVQEPYFLLRIPALGQAIDLTFPDLPAIVELDVAPLPFLFPVPTGPLEATMMIPREDRMVIGYVPMRVWSGPDTAGLVDFESARRSALVQDLLAEVIDVLRWPLTGFRPSEETWGSLSKVVARVEGMTLRTAGRPRPVFVSVDGVEHTTRSLLAAV